MYQFFKNVKFNGDFSFYTKNVLVFFFFFIYLNQVGLKGQFNLHLEIIICFQWHHPFTESIQTYLYIPFLYHLYTFITLS